MKFLLGFVVGLILLPLLAFLYVRLGYAPVATAGPPLPMERTITSMALNARVSREAPDKSPIQPTEQNLLAGAKIYRENCAVCHGILGQPQTAISKGMYPKPPHLFQGKGVSDDPVGETYWKATNGIRLTGMPAFRGSLSEEELWQVSQLLATSDKLPASVTQFLAQPSPAK